MFNPTLSLSSISVGYESLAASGSLLALGIVIKDFIDKKEYLYDYIFFVSGVNYSQKIQNFDSKKFNEMMEINFINYIVLMNLYG